MRSIETAGSRMTVAWSMGFLRVMAVAFLAFGVLGAVAAALAPHADVVGALGPILALTAIGVVMGFIPFGAVTVLDRDGTVEHTARRLFGDKRRRATRVTGVRFVVGTRYAWVDLHFAEDPPLSALMTPKQWTWDKDVPDLHAQARQVAEFLGVPLA